MFPGCLVDMLQAEEDLGKGSEYGEEGKDHDAVVGLEPEVNKVVSQGVPGLNQDGHQKDKANPQVHVGVFHEVLEFLDHGFFLWD